MSALSTHARTAHWSQFCNICDKESYHGSNLYFQGRNISDDFEILPSFVKVHIHKIDSVRFIAKYLSKTQNTGQNSNGKLETKPYPAGAPSPRFLLGKFYHFPTRKGKFFCPLTKDFGVQLIQGSMRSRIFSTSESTW